MTTKQRRIPDSAVRPTRVNRTAKGLLTQTFPPSDIEPLERYNILHNANSVSNFGFEHPFWQEMLDHANTLVDEEERWAQQAKMARWIFDNVMVIAVYGENLVWPLGPKLDPWKPLGGNKILLSSWEEAPHRAK